MKRNLWWTLMMIAALSMALTLAVACGDDDDDDDDDAAGDDDDATGDDDDASGTNTAYNECLDWADDCGFSAFEIGSYCDGLQSLETGSACIDGAVGAYFDCLIGTGCTDFGGILSCLNDFGVALADCY